MLSIQNLTDQSSFIFEGTLYQFGASTCTTFAATSETAIVQVTRILKGAPVLAGIAGGKVTLRLQLPTDLKVGQAVVIFTNGLWYGDGIVLAEVGHLIGDTQTIERQINMATEAYVRRAVEQRIASAVMVVSGIVAATKPFRYEGPISFHDPDWWECIVSHNVVLMGSISKSTVSFLFANSKDIMWRSAPKFTVGQRGVWMPHENRQFTWPSTEPVVVNPLDFQPAEQLSTLQNLIQAAS